MVTNSAHMDLGMQIYNPYSLISVTLFPHVLASFTRQGGTSHLWGAIWVVRSHKGLLTEAEIVLTISLLQDMKQWPREQNLYYFCHIPPVSL